MILRLLLWLIGAPMDEPAPERVSQFIGGRWDGMTERDAGRLIHRIGADADSCWLEIVDPITGRGDRYEQFGQDWFWAGRVGERV